MQARVLEHSTRAEACFHKHLSYLVGRKNITFISQQLDKRDQSAIQPDWPSAIWTTSGTVTVAAGSLFPLRVPSRQSILLVNMDSDYPWAWMKTHNGEGIHVLQRVKVSCLPRRGLVCVFVGEGGGGRTGACTCVHTYIHA